VGSALYKSIHFLEQNALMMRLQTLQILGLF
jgi:hypothetical protein